MAMIRGYFWLSKAWYGPSQLADAPDTIDEIMFGLYEPEGGTAGEMKMNWIDLGPPPGVVPQLEIFDDAWHLFDDFGDVFMALAEQRAGMRPQKFAALLDSLEFEDMTPTTQ